MVNPHMLRSSTFFFRLLSLIFCFLLPTIAAANFKPDFWMRPYLGFDAGLRHMTWGNDFGNNVFERHPLQANMYVGLRVTPFLGIEAGYETISHKKRDRIIGGVDTSVIVLNEDFDGPFALHSTTKLSGWHLNVVGFYPVEAWDCFELMGSVGIASLKTAQQAVYISSGLGNINPPSVYTFSKSKVVPRVAVGFQYKFTENLGVRIVLLGTENTSLFNYLKPTEDPVAPTMARMKHNTYHSIGVNVAF